VKQQTLLAAEHYPVLVTGARGLLGHALGPYLASAAPAPDALRLTDIEELDVTDEAAVAATMRDLEPRTVFHLAAWTDVDGAEAHPDEAARLNVEAAEHMARAARQAGALLVHISTDFVFDGTKDGPYVEDDPPNPLGVYGRTKAASETRVRAAAPDNHLIARAALLYGAGGRNFVDSILAAANEGKPLRVTTDLVGCPTWSDDLARALVAMVNAGLRGTYHACGAGAASRWEWAVETVRAAGLQVAVQPVTSAAWPSAAQRPARAVLSTEKLARAAGFRFPDWRESIRDYVHASRGA